MMVPVHLTRWIRYVLLIFPLCILLISLSVGETEARTFIVDQAGDGDHLTIQEAVEASHQYDTIIIENGTYHGLVNVTKPLTIMGRSNETVIIDAHGVGSGMNISANEVTISDLRVVNATNTNVYNFGIASWYSSSLTLSRLNISSCILGVNLFHSQDVLIEYHSSFNSTFGISCYSVTNATITGSTFLNSTDMGMSFIISTHLNITGNVIRFSNGISDNDGTGIYMDEVTNATISGNTISNNSYNGIKIGRMGEGTVISRNIISGNGESGIMVSGVHGGNISNNVVDKNQITGIRFDSYRETLYWEFTNNTISGSTYGIRVDDAEMIKVIGNSIHENSYGILIYKDWSSIYRENNISGNYKFGLWYQASYSGNVDVKNNWWGDASGPYNHLGNPQGMGDNISTRDVKFIPWIGLNERPIKNIVSGKEYYDLQVAVDEVGENDTVRVLWGYYQINLLIDRPLSLIGNGSDEVTLDGGGDGTVISVLSDNVTISGFTIRRGGDRSRSPHGRDAGIHIFGSNCTVIGNVIENGDGEGILVYRAENVTIAENTVVNNHEIGIKVSHSNWIRIRDNNCTGNKYGINIFSSSNTSIVRNSIQENDYEGIHLELSSHCRLKENVVEDTAEKRYPLGWNFGLKITGFDLDQWNSHDIDTSNTVDGSAINYYKNITNIEIIPGGNIILANCSYLLIEGLSSVDRTSTLR